MKQNQKIGYFYLLPLAILVAVFMIYPFFNGIFLSLFSTKYGFGDLTFAGFDNFIKIFQDEYFWTAAKNSLIWVFFGLILSSIIPMAIALFLNRQFHGKQAVLTSMMVPWITPVVGLALIVRWFLEPNLGLVNNALRSLGILHDQINFFGSTDLAMPTLVFINFWQFCPFGVLLMLSVFSTIDNEQKEAMRVDGAGSWKIFTKLIMPQSGSMLTFMLFFGIVLTFNNYSIVYLTTKGGPSMSTYTIPMLIYEKAFKEFNSGEAMAVATVMGITLIAVGFLYFKFCYKPQET